MNDEFLTYYNRELAYVRELGDEFAQAFPKIAGRLRLKDIGSDDPHVERLTQAFAFLTARIQQKLDDDFPQLAETVLEILHPHFLSPIPSITVVKFNLDKTAGKLTTSHQIPRHSILTTELVGGEPCRFRTANPVTLWPLHVEAASLSGPPFAVREEARPADAASLLRVKLGCLNAEVPIAQLEIDSLQFFLHGQRDYIQRLYELLFNDVIQVCVVGEDQTPQVVGDARCLTPGGFRVDDSLLPRSRRTPPGYELLTDYFAFPEKFLFVDAGKLQEPLSRVSGASAELLFFLRKRREDLEHYISDRTFHLGCTPVVNLFRQTAEPIRLTHEQSEYQVIPSSRRPGGMEVFSVDRVTATNPDGQIADVLPVYSAQDTVRGASQRLFWTMSRKQGRRRENQADTGTDVFLSIVDHQLDPNAPAESVLSIETTCSNRDLTRQLPFGGGRPGMEMEMPAFQLEQGGPVASIACLMHPTVPRRPRLGRGAVWRLISHLSLNHMSITGGESGAEALSELLKLYDVLVAESDDEPFRHDAILSVTSRPIVGRMNQSDLTTLSGTRSPETAFCRGIETTVELDEARFVGAGEFLFASVLEQFLALYASVNSFSKMVLRTKQRGELRRWPPRTGERMTR